VTAVVLAKHWHAPAVHVELAGQVKSTLQATVPWPQNSSAMPASKLMGGGVAHDAATTRTAAASVPTAARARMTFHRSTESAAGATTGPPRLVPGQPGKARTAPRQEERDAAVNARP
jgi:hypothetical protein